MTPQLAPVRYPQRRFTDPCSSPDAFYHDRLCQEGKTVCPRCRTYLGYSPPIRPGGSP